MRVLVEEADGIKETFFEAMRASIGGEEIREQRAGKEEDEVVDESGCLTWEGMGLLGQMEGNRFEIF